jgi:DNA polymerase III delta prime subunit
MRLLQRVRSFWITGVFEQSLHGAALLALGLQEQPNAVANPWRLIIQESELASTPLPPGTRIREVYDKAHGELLILGEPGAGKTTLLLELARDLLGRAEQEQAHPIPVVFHLSSWMRKRQPLATWLIEELETKYWVPRGIGFDWINANQILPLLDGLDEIDAPSRSACMQAINEYHQAHSLVPLVVCCRMSEYLSQSHRLALSSAVTIQPLTTEQVNAYFARIGEKIASLRLAFQHDPVLQELATTPLMLTILTLAYQDSSLEETERGVSAEVRRQQIFATYTQRMLGRRSAGSRYGLQQTIHWLSYLAQQMKQQSQTVFYLERMQPTWLLKKWQRRLYYGLTTGPISGLFVGLQILGTVLPFALTVLMTALTFGGIFGWLSEPAAEKKSLKTITRVWMRIRQHLATALEDRVKIGVAAGFVVGIGSTLYNYLSDVDNWSFGSRIVGALSGGLPGGICMGVYVGLTIGLERRIEPLEGSSWSWTGIRRDSVRWLLIGSSLIVGLIFAFPFLLASHDVRSANFLSYGLSTAFQLVVIVMLVSGVTRGLSKRVLDVQHMVTPNQGIWRSARSGVVMAIITGGILGAFSAAIDLLAYSWLPLHTGSSIKPLVMDYSAVSIMSHLLGFSPTTSQEFWTLHALFWWLVNGAIPALAVGLYCGGAACVQHFVLRFLLWCTRSLPLNYPRFLDYATERILLRKVGGGYIFIHRSLLEYFADMETGKTVDVARSLAPAPLQMPVDPGERNAAPTYADQSNSDEQKDPLQPVSTSLPTPQTTSGDFPQRLQELDERLVEMKRVDVLTGITMLDQPEALLGHVISEYRLVRKLGSGSFGTVYLAEHQHEHRLSAVKVLHIPHISGENLRGFINEARTMRLRHPHIVPLLDFGISRGGLPFLVMEYAPQGTVRGRHPKSDRVALPTIVSYVDQLASALQYAHDQRIIHRDIKPENILIRLDGTLMVSDFGLAKLTEQDVIIGQQKPLGSPAYIAPEQQRGYPCFASDQYALAVVIYEWICGFRPFQGTVQTQADQHMNTSPPSLLDYLPEHAQDVERVIFKALAKAPEDRFERIEKMASALREAAQSALSGGGASRS